MASCGVSWSHPRSSLDAGQSAAPSASIAGWRTQILKALLLRVVEQQLAQQIARQRMYIVTLKPRTLPRARQPDRQHNLPCWRALEPARFEGYETRFETRQGMMRQPARFELPPQAATARRLPKPMLPTMLPATTLPRLTALSLPSGDWPLTRSAAASAAATAARSSRSRRGVGRCRLGDCSGAGESSAEVPARSGTAARSYWNGAGSVTGSASAQSASRRRASHRRIWVAVAREPCCIFGGLSQPSCGASSAR